MQTKAIDFTELSSALCNAARFWHCTRLPLPHPLPATTMGFIDTDTTHSLVCIALASDSWRRQVPNRMHVLVMHPSTSLLDSSPFAGWCATWSFEASKRVFRWIFEAKGGIRTGASDYEWIETDPVHSVWENPPSDVAGRNRSDERSSFPLVHPDPTGPVRWISAAKIPCRLPAWTGGTPLPRGQGGSREGLFSIADLEGCGWPLPRRSNVRSRKYPGRRTRYFLLFANARI